MNAQTYLGDGAYAEWTGNSCRLFTSNGIHETNQIFLEPEHIKRLEEFIESIRTQQQSLRRLR